MVIVNRIIILTCIASLGGISQAFGVSKTDTLSFIFEGKRLSGFLDVPQNKAPSSIVIIVPGYGKTNFGKADWYYDSIRVNFVKKGVACFLWDKIGCGKSQGVFDPEQPVEKSAEEVVTAIEELRKREIPGSENIGLWGISRAGWICPLVIRQYQKIAFWISVSGTDDKENFGYLLESNFLIEGRSEAQTNLLVSEWKKGNDIFREGGSFEVYQKATYNLRRDSFWISVNGDPLTDETYERAQKDFIKANHQFDQESGLMVYIPGFKEILKDINCPVLAIFGEKDANVDWRKTKALYEGTIGQNRNSNLTVKMLPKCNHSIIQCETGGLNENIETWRHCDDYFETLNSWLTSKGFAEN